MTTISDLTTRLEALHARTADTPLFNPVFQLSLDLSRLIESGQLDLEDCESLIGEIECEALKSRAERLRRLVGPVSLATNEQALEFLIAGEDFEAIRARWEQPHLHVVFTGHPTFLLTSAQSAAVAVSASSEGAIGSEVCLVSAKRPPITLAHEHGEAMRAVAYAQDARDAIVRKLLEWTQRQWPGEWMKFVPLPFRFATWVGYDMDGRTDIGWAQSIGFRLAEKAERLARYAASLESIDAEHHLLGDLRSAADYAAERAKDFASDLSDPAAISSAANRLTASDPRKLLSLTPYIDALEDEAGETNAKRAVSLKILSGAMRADGLGMGWIHFRVNAKQLHNGIRKRLDPEGALDLSSKGALVQLREAIAKVRRVRSNFAALATESSTAIRQFVAMVQILSHIDSDAPIRMLVAECEEPTTILAALYFAHLFGIEDKIDISPLLETEAALEHGGRLLDALFKEEAYRTYARSRGRVSVQTGFSDAGRFVGQIPASLAIERLQGRVAQAMQAHGLTDVTALIFNTHGESMGRGAHSASFADRMTWPLSRWARQRFVRAGIRLEPEVSFQGGDGYLFFATPEMALATLTRIAELHLLVSNLDGPDDLFYSRSDLSLDFYRAVRDHQHSHLESRTYARAVNAFGLGLLNRTGSRASRRQSDLSSDREVSLRQIRAIPHNAILQQLGYPVNVIAGVGSAAERNYEEVSALLAESERGRQLMRLVRAANAVASVKTVAAYGELFNPAYWASRTYRGTERHLSSPCEALAQHFVKDDRNGVFRRLASRLRIDALRLHRLLALMPEEQDSKDSETTRRAIGVCHALRLALFQHMFIRAVSIPAFSRTNDVSRDDVIEMVFSLRIDEALAQLRRAYPTSFPKIGDFNLTEQTDYPEDGGEGYEGVRRVFIDPIERSYSLALRITTAIANHFGAHG